MMEGEYKMPKDVESQKNTSAEECGFYYLLQCPTTDRRMDLGKARQGKVTIIFKMSFPFHRHHNRFTALFPGLPGWAGARRELLDFMMQGKINRGRHTNHPAGRHSILTNQCPPPPTPHFLQAGCPSCHQTNSVKALKAPSALGLGRRR